MRVLITGATGLVGTEVAKALFQQGHEIAIVSRDPEKARNHFVFPVEVFKWDAPYGEFPVEAVRGVDGVVNLLGEDIAARRWSSDQKKRIYDSRVVGTRKLAEALSRASVVPKVFVGASAVGFYGDRGEEILTEALPAGKGFLPDICSHWEKESQSIRALRSVILRLGVVLSQEGGFLPRLLAVFNKGLGGSVGGGKQWISWIHIQDLVQLFTHALTDESISGIRNAASATPVTNREFGSTLAAVLDKPFGFPTPAFALRLAMGEMASLALDSTRAVGSTLTTRFRFPVLREALEELLRAERERVTIFEANQWVARPLGEVFEFFSSPHNLEILSPPWLHFHVVGQSTQLVENGTLIDYKLRIKKIPARWQSRIEEWTPPRKFVDTQIHGPYKHWHHTHTFESMRGGTWLKDIVRYQLPLGVVGGLLMSGQIRKDVHTIFEYRKKKIRELFG